VEAIGDADLVYAPSLDEIHPDHRALGMAAAEAVRRRGGNIRIAFYEVSAPLKPNLLLDISDVAERKAAAIGCFRSQLEKQRYDAHAAALNAYRTYTLPASVTAAEAYHVVSAESLAADPVTLHRAEAERRLGDAIARLHDVENRLIQVESTERERHRIMRERFELLEQHAERTRLQAEALVARMRASTSWRVTAPLRAASLMVRRLTGRPLQ
jgi:LmbE family N-acetylglucosaminyl deacetylase